jgi:hypothetical protein
VQGWSEKQRASPTVKATSSNLALVPRRIFFNQSVARGLARIQYKKPHPSLRSFGSYASGCSCCSVQGLGCIDIG